MTTALATDGTVEAGRRRGAPDEMPFGFDEVFFSRTDKRGVIQAGNEVFQRVSGFGWDKLLGAPHKIVRHPATPRGVFHLLWDRLKAGRSTGAYVCNATEDGRYYWVFALLSPIADGYLSVRIKPGSAEFDEVRALYARLCEAEAAGRSPADSAAALTAALREAGHPDYESFQSRALSREMAARAAKTGRPARQRDRQFEAMAASASEIERLTSGMMRTFGANRTIPLNLRVLSSRLGDLGRPISAISINYASLSEEMSAWLRERTGNEEAGFARIRRSILAGAFYASGAELMREMSETFARSAAEAGIDKAEESTRLSALADAYRGEETACLSRVLGDVQAMEFGVTEMKRFVTGLSSIRMLCKIESAVLRARGGELDGIVSQLDAFQDEIETPLAEITNLNHDLQAAAARLS